MKRVLSITETTAAILLLLIALLVAGNVVARELFGTTLPDWFDGSRLLLGVALFWGIALATYHGSHIAVDLLWEHLGPKNRRRLDVLAAISCVLFFAPLAWMVWVKVGSVGTQATSDLRLPLVWFNSVAAVGVTACAVLAVMRAVQLIADRGDEYSERQDGS